GIAEVAPGGTTPSTQGREARPRPPGTCDRSSHRTHGPDGYHAGMIRSRPFLAAMHRLAFVATLLMVCAPLVSRWLQAAPPDPQALCTTEGLRVAALASPAMAGAHAGYAMATTAGEAHGGGHAPDDGSGHAGHGF